MGSSRHTTQGWGVSAYPTAIHAINVPGTSNDTRTGVEALAKRFDAGRAMEIPSSITPLSRMGFSTYQPSATLERRGHSSFPSPDSDAPAGSHTCPDGYEWYSCTEDTLFIFKGCCRIDPCKMVGYCPKWAFAVAAGEPDEYQALTAVSSYEGWTEILLQSTHDGKAEQFTIRASTRHGEASLTTSTRSESSTTSTRSLFSGTSMTSMTGSAYGNPPTATDADTGYEGVPISTGEPESAQHNKLSGGAIAGIVIGVVAGVAIMAGALLFWWWKRRRNQGNMSGPVPPVADYKDTDPGYQETTNAANAGGYYPAYADAGGYYPDHTMAAELADTSMAELPGRELEMPSIVAPSGGGGPTSDGAELPSGLSQSNTPVKAEFQTQPLEEKKATNELHP